MKLGHETGGAGNTDGNKMTLGNLTGARRGRRLNELPVKGRWTRVTRGDLTKGGEEKEKKN